MARIRMVTRTIEALEVTAMTVDTTTASVLNKPFVLTGVSNLDNDKLLAKVKKEYETETTKIVSIVSTKKHEELFGMTEIEFLRYARKLDPQTRKMLDEEFEINAPEELTEDEQNYVESDAEIVAEVAEEPTPKKSKKGGRK